jgi:hypothetical protein
MGTLLREPLVHFLLIGAMLFGAYTLMSDEQAASSGNRIEVTAAIIQRLGDAWTKQWRRPPTDAELAGLITDHIREEVLYREAVALGLDQDDTIIRRRLAQKMEFLVQDIAAQAEPTEVELLAFFAENQARFVAPARLSFSHIFFSRDLRGQDTARDAELVLAELRAAGSEGGPDRGDRFMLQYEYQQIDQRDAAALFGAAFGERLFQLEPGAWQGPIESGYGLHLVRVTDRTELRIPALADVRQRVLNEYQYQRRQQVDQQTIQRLKARYEIVIEAAQPSQTADAKPADDSEDSG